MKQLDGELIKRISEEYGDSFYILDTDVFTSNCERLLESFRNIYANTNLAYSYKTNYIPRLCSVISKLGGYAETVSDMEINLALRIGVQPSWIIWNGPVKEENALEKFVLSGGIVNIDSLVETESICKIADNNPNSMISVGVRCNYDVGDGVISRFGFDIETEEFLVALSMISERNNISLKSIQAHFAKRSPEYWKARTEGLLKAYSIISERFHLYPSIVDLGGGMSGNMPDELAVQLNTVPVSYDSYASIAAKTIADYFSNKSQNPELVLEPGTAVAANSMRYICQVKSIKHVREKTIVTTSGSQKNIGMTGLNPPMTVVNMTSDRMKCVNADIAGYTCIESDYIFRGYTGEIGIGDFLVIGSCGSYSIVMKPPFIRPNVPILEFDNDEIRVIKRAELFDDLFSTYIF